MVYRIINNKKYLWIKNDFTDSAIYVVGGIWYENDFYEKNEACILLRKIIKKIDFNNEGWIHNSEKIISFLKQLQGHFSFIIDTKDYIIASVDRIRSFPVFYSYLKWEMLISNSAEELRSNIPLCDIEYNSKLELLMSGFVTGNRTLFKDIFQIQAGEVLIYHKTKHLYKTERFYIYHNENKYSLTEDELIDKHEEIINETFDQLISSLNGKSVWIPLSGGLDSRLVLGKFIDAKYDRINTFTYGIPQLWEVKFARELTQRKNLKWTYVEYKPKEVKRQYHQKDRQDYYRYASGLCSVPFVSDFYAIKKLIEKQQIKKNDFIINGQSGDFITGGHIPEFFKLTNKQFISIEKLIELIINKHFSLWKNYNTDNKLKIIKKNLFKQIMPFCNNEIEIGRASDLYELHEWQERQSKYVVNGQRVYDWFQLNWRLPLWSDGLLRFWSKIPWSIKFNQQLYKKYLHKYNPGKLFRIDININRNYCPAFLKIPDFIYSKIANTYNLDKEFFNKACTKYFGAYAPFYPQSNYLQYMKDSIYHRNTVSYYARYLLREVLAAT